MENSKKLFRKEKYESLAESQVRKALISKGDSYFEI